MSKISKADAEFLGEIDPNKLRGPKKASHIILFAVITFIVVAIVWANYAILDEVTRGEGKVIPSREIQKIQNLEGGIVKKIMIKEGQIVNKGQPLLQIDDVRFTATYKENYVKQISMEIRLARLKSAILDKPFKVSRELTKQQPETVSFERALYKAHRQELSQLKDSYQLAIQELNMTRPLVSKGAASPVEVLRLQRAASDLNAKVTNFRSTRLDELNKTKAELVVLKESNIAHVDRLKRTTVRSPLKGIVKQLLINTEGGVVQPGMDLVEIVPLDDTLLVEAKIKPKDIGFLKPNMPATVNITAYDYAIYGALDGKVEQISADAILDEKTQESHYLVKVRTKKNYLGTKEEPLYIIPGMQASVDIMTGKKSVLDYILNPIITSASRALEEK